MTTMTYVSQAQSVRSAGFTAALRAEWGKLWSVRSSWITLSLGVLAGIGVALLNVFFREGEATYATIAAEVAGTAGLVAIPIMVFAVISVTAEYSSRAVHNTLLGTPRRNRLLGAKALSVGLAAFLTAVVATGLGFAVTLVGAKHVGGALGDSGVLFPMLVAPVVVALLAVWAMALGTLLRSAAGAISLVLVEQLALGSLIGLVLRNDIGRKIGHSLPNYASGQLLSAVKLTPHVWGQLAVLLAWVIGGLVVAGYALHRRDA
ncbi:hypothetical protein D5S17_11510 [Pseudonocardiaceae bacterium YIM PH 21723]|nr:hypothetical protein D5S17_11510 [Pseudonocardiaceae bacterium YIM PH 21723]